MLLGRLGKTCLSRYLCDGCALGSIKDFVFLIDVWACCLAGFVMVGGFSWSGFLCVRGCGFSRVDLFVDS